MAPARPALPPVEIVIDGQPARAPEGATILRGVPRTRASTPRRSAILETLTPVNVCRVCVVEVKAPACWCRPARAAWSRAWTIRTDSERVRLSRRMVLELLASSVDLSTAPGVDRLMARYGAARSATARPRRPRPASATRASPATTTAPDGAQAETVAQPVKIDNDLYVRDYSQVHPLLQVRRGLRHRRAEHLRHRGRRPRLRRPHLHRVRRPAARLGLRLLRQLHRRLPHRRAHVQERARHARGGHLGRGPADARPTPICPYCGVGCTLTLHVQDNRIVKVTSPADVDGHPRPPVHQGALRLHVRRVAPRRGSPRALTAAPWTRIGRGRASTARGNIALIFGRWFDMPGKAEPGSGRGLTARAPQGRERVSGSPLLHRITGIRDDRAVAASRSERLAALHGSPRSRPSVIRLAKTARGGAIVRRRAWQAASKPRCRVAPSRGARHGSARAGSPG